MLSIKMMENNYVINTDRTKFNKIAKIIGTLSVHYSVIISTINK